MLLRQRHHVLSFVGISILFSLRPIYAQNCNLTVPANPLTTGLGSVWMVTGCNQTDPAQTAFAEATLFNKQTNQFRVYHPLLIPAGTQPLVPPTPITVDPNEIVALHFGCNGNSLTLMDTGGSLAAGVCVNGLPDNIFGQFSHCNAVAFFQAVNAAIQAGGVTVPPLGTDVLGNICPTTRSFEHVDQDPSDNIGETLLAMNGQVAQNIPANVKQFPNATMLTNPGDNRLLAVAINPAIGCKPFMAVDATDPTGATMTGSLALNEISANANQASPVALVEPGNPMVVDGNGNYSIPKVNLYRAAVNQPPLDPNADPKAQDVSYCMNLLNIGAPYIQKYQPYFAVKKSPLPVASNLFTFMVQRFAAAWKIVQCPARLNLQTEPITAMMDNNQVCIGAIFNFGTGANGQCTPNTFMSPTIATAVPAPAPQATTAVNPAAGTTTNVMMTAPCNVKIGVQYPSTCPAGPMRLRKREESQQSTYQDVLVAKAVKDFEDKLFGIYAFGA